MSNTLKDFERKDTRKARTFGKLDKALQIPVYLYSCVHWQVFTTARAQYCSQCAMEQTDRGKLKSQDGVTGMMGSRLVGVALLTLDPETKTLRAQVLEAPPEEKS